MSGGGTPSKPAPAQRRAALSATSGGSTASGTADAQRAQRIITLMTEIRQLGRFPREAKGCSEDESRLAHRLHDAKGKGHLSESQLAELAEMPGSDLREERAAALMAEIRALGRVPKMNPGHPAENKQLAELAEMPRSDVREARVAALMAEIRALGRVPKMTERHPAENKLPHRLRDAKRYNRLSETQLAELAEMPRAQKAKRKRLLSESQLADLAEMPRAESREELLMADIRALGQIPPWTPGPHYQLARRLHHAKRKSRLSESQLAELAEMPDNRRVMQRLAR